MSKQADEVKSWRLSDAYTVPGFRVLQRVDGHEFRPGYFRTDARPASKKTARCGCCGKRTDRIYDKRWRRARDLGCGDREVYLDFEMRRVNCKTCGVKNEKLDFLSDNTKYTLRFAMQIGGLCRAMTIKDVSRHMRLDWHTVKDLEKIYMREQLRLAGPPRPEVIGVDEISIRKGHTYRIAVSDLEKKRAIWFGGDGRTQTDMDRFYAELGEEAAKKIRLAVMDMWKPFRKSARQHAPQAAIVLDKFHILRHLSDALDGVRRAEYKRVTGDERTFIKGQRYVLLSRRENLSDGGRQNLERLLQANARLNIAYLLREQFEQLWSYTDPRMPVPSSITGSSNCRDRTWRLTRSSPA